MHPNDRPTQKKKKKTDDDAIFIKNVFMHLRARLACLRSAYNNTKNPRSNKNCGNIL